MVADRHGQARACQQPLKTSSIETTKSTKSAMPAVSPMSTSESDFDLVEANSLFTSSGPHARSPRGNNASQIGDVLQKARIFQVQSEGRTGGCTLQLQITGCSLALDGERALLSGNGQHANVNFV